MAIRYAFDLYPRLDPIAGARLVRFSKRQEAEYRGTANGTGSGKLVMRATDEDADFIDPAGMQYVRVVRINTDVVDGGTLSGFDEKVIGGFFLERGEFQALSTNSTKKLTFTGAGTLSYLDRATAAAATYIAGSDGPFDDTWHWYYSTAGSILHRMVTEALDPDRPQSPIAGVTMSFTPSLDSDGGAWPGYGDSWLFTATVGESLLSICRRLMEAGLYVTMDPDTFELSAWVANTHGRDRTGVAWGADVVRFQSPDGLYVSTGNIKSDATRGLKALIKRSDLLIGGEDNWAWVHDAGADLVWEGGYRNPDPTSGSLADVAAAQLSARSDASDTVRLRMVLGDDEMAGAYLPFEHVQLDDQVTLNTSGGQWRWDEAEMPVAAITLQLRRGGDWDAIVDLGSQFTDIRDRTFQVAGVGCVCIRLCQEFVPGGDGIPDIGDTGPSDLAQDGEHTHGTAPRATRCDHRHEHGDLSPSAGPHHAAAAITYDPTVSGLAATDVQAAIDELVGTVEVVALTRFQFELRVAGVLGVASNVAAYYRIPYNAIIDVVVVHVGTAPATQAILIDVNDDGTTIFTTQGNRPSIAAGTNDDDSGTPDGGTAVVANSVITVDVDQVGVGTPGSDLTVFVRGRWT